MDLSQNKITREASSHAIIAQRNDKEAPKISYFDTRGLAVKIDTI